MDYTIEDYIKLRNDSLVNNEFFCIVIFYDPPEFPNSYVVGGFTGSNETVIYNKCNNLEEAWKFILPGMSNIGRCKDDSSSIVEVWL